ncbi:uncharacterized protein EDB93DRAFT_1131952 [Suillus bovinus]|uniref:uncharacterized protein n=1 Tax=Suillus bovinus TaxID=48563 RepID=UPI001B880B71|nr:uncharacterized protein EDB93DRAFT_1131952 [Suillus bovinus]KAG2154389.1 hypothetical protein EDB93DRAFT_1131952 [Suillus bovinus]
MLLSQSPLFHHPQSCLRAFNLMHQALCIAEILDQISWHTDRGSLPGLALTCRTFEGPALDALWRNLQSLEPLVNCIPTHFWGFNFQGELMLLRPIDTKVWATFRRYASRVHSITQSGDPSPIIEHLRILMLSYPYPSSTMFPALQSLAWNVNQTHLIIEFLRMAFVPSLVSLDLRITSISPALMSVLSTIGTACPNLTSFRPQVDDPTWNRELAPFLTQAICQLHHLSALTVCELEDPGMMHVTQLQSLKTLWLYIGPSFLRRTGLLPQSLGLEHLEHLGLQAIRLNHMTDFLRSLGTVRSKHITAVFSSNAFGQQSDSISQFCTMVLERCDNDTLEAITLCEQFYNTFHNVYAQPSDFGPLRLLRNLTYFDVEAACTISISNDGLGELVKAWPKLTTFRLNCYRDPTSTVLPTFHGLINVLRLCPELVSLSLVIDTTQLDGIDIKSPGNGIGNNGLQDLVLGNSPISSPLDVALVLSSLLPNLMGVNLSPWIGGPLDALFAKQWAMEQWKQVNRLLGGFHIVRTRFLGQ